MKKKEKLIQECILFLSIYLYNYVSYITLISIKLKKIIIIASNDPLIPLIIIIWNLIFQLKQFTLLKLRSFSKFNFRRKFLDGDYSPVHRDHAEIQDASRATEHVEANPKIAHNCTEGPITGNLVE